MYWTDFSRSSPKGPFVSTGSVTMFAKTNDIKNSNITTSVYWENIIYGYNNIEWDRQCSFYNS